MEKWFDVSLKDKGKGKWKANGYREAKMRQLNADGKQKYDKDKAIDGKESE